MCDLDSEQADHRAPPSTSAWPVKEIGTTGQHSLSPGVRTTCRLSSHLWEGRSQGPRLCSTVDWRAFRRQLQDAPDDQDFLGLVSAAAQAATIQSRVPEHHPVPDLHHLKLRAARRRAERRYLKAQDPAHRTLFNRVDAVCRRHANRRRRQSWQGICHSLSQARGGAKAWRLLRSIVIGPTVRQPILAVAIHLGISEQELAERLADRFTTLPLAHPAAITTTPAPKSTARPPPCLDCQPDCSSVSGAHFRTRNEWCSGQNQAP
ncbi:hypothetical protein MTO96_046624 [Rhipicephalus appendiculatus]